MNFKINYLNSKHINITLTRNISQHLNSQIFTVFELKCLHSIWTRMFSTAFELERFHSIWRRIFLQHLNSKDFTAFEFKCFHSVWTRKISQHLNSNVFTAFELERFHSIWSRMFSQHLNSKGNGSEWNGSDLSQSSNIKFASTTVYLFKNMASLWLPNTEEFFETLLRLIETSESNFNSTSYDSCEFLYRRLDASERTLSTLFFLHFLAWSWLDLFCALNVKHDVCER
jgi:hypothetical protein